MAAQATAALSSFVLQLGAARNLGASRYGTFTILLAALVLLAALHGGLVGDTRTVLDRTAPHLRGPLAVTSTVFAATSFAVGGLGSWSFGLLDAAPAAGFGLLAAFWVLEDGGRRIFMARLEFWRLVANDLSYAAGTVVVLGILASGGHTLSLADFLLSMGCGALTAVLVARVQLPREELAHGAVTAAGLREVATFGSWRAAQAGIRPLATLVLRALVRVLASSSALGRLEVARLAVAPALILANGVGSFLLPYHATRRRSTGTDPVPSPGPVAVLVALTLAYGAVVTVLAPRLADVATGGRVTVDAAAVAGWSIFAAAVAAGIPAGTAVLARGRSSLVFRLRAVDSVVGLVVAIALTVISASLAPWGLAVGAVVGGALLWSEVRASPRGAHR
ncbi:MAG: hypothetical protein H0U89_01430 [Acidimicrobiia bacterium]|nr:hypothetical protein [Acidimicrobiia bacterium]